MKIHNTCNSFISEFNNEPCSNINNTFLNSDFKLDKKTNNIYLNDVLIGKLINNKLERIQKNKVTMNKERYKSLCKGDSDKLTKEEVEQGWFFCCELDYALVNKKDEHIKHICLCINNNN